MITHIPLFEDFGNVLKNAGVTTSGKPEEAPEPINPETEVLPGEKPAPVRRERQNPNRRRPNYVPKENPAKAFLRIVHEAINYNDPDTAKMHQDLEQTLTTGAHPYKEHPSFPQGNEDASGAQELALDQFNTVISKLTYYLGDDVHVDKFDQMTVYKILVSALQEITRLESDHKEELEEMAVKIVTDYFNIKEGDFTFDAKLVNIGEVDISMIKQQEEALEAVADDEMEPGNEEEVLALPDDPEDIETMLQRISAQAQAQDQEQNQEINKDAQISKRRMLNAIIQGAANNSQYLFNFVNDKLRAIDQDLPKLYGMMISSNDLNYWLWSDEQMKQAQQDGSAAGNEEVDAKTDPPTIKARGINFPVLIHELVKGVMEYYAMFGLPENAASAEDVLSKTEFLDIEKWDLRFGPTIWRRFISAVGADDWEEIKQYLIVEINEMPAEEFNRFMKELISGSDEGKRKMSELAQKVRDDMRNDNYKDAMDEAVKFNETFIPNFITYIRESSKG
jgi:hypothetical protein